MKRHGMVTVIVVTAACLTACAGSGGQAAGKQPADAGNSSGQTSQAEVQKIKVTCMQPEGTPEDMAMKAMNEKIEELSGGKIQVEYYPNGQIGSIPESVQNVQMGVTQIAIAPCAIIASFCEEAALMDLPYLLPQNPEVISEVMNSDIGREFMDQLEPTGLHGLGVWFAGFREMTSNRDINSVKDMSGLKMRIMESNILTETYNALGAQPVVVAYSETYNALSNGTVDAQENPAQSTYTMNFYEVQKYIVETYHDAQVHIILTNGSWYNALDDETKEILAEAEKAGRAVLDAELPGYTQSCIDKMVEAGCEYHVFNKDQITEFQEATSSVYEKFTTTDWRKNYLPRLNAAFENAAKKE